MDAQKNGTTLEEILEVINRSFTGMEQRFGEKLAGFEQRVDQKFTTMEQSFKENFTTMGRRLDTIESDVVEIKSDVTDLKADVHELNTTMVTKDYLDRRIQELKDDLTKLDRKTNEKIVATIRTLRDKSVLSDVEATPILTMAPFPVPR